MCSWCERHALMWTLQSEPYLKEEWKYQGIMQQVFLTVVGMWNNLPAFAMTSVSCRTKIFSFFFFFPPFWFDEFLQNALAASTRKTARKMLCNGHITTH